MRDQYELRRFGRTPRDLLRLGVNSTHISMSVSRDLAKRRKTYIFKGIRSRSIGGEWGGREFARATQDLYRQGREQQGGQQRSHYEVKGRIEQDIV